MVEAGNSPAVSRLTLNGQSYQVFFNTNLTKPSGLSIDFLSGTLYVADIEKVEQIDLMKQTRKVFHLSSDITPFQLTTIAQYVVFSINESTKYGIINVDRDLFTMVDLQSSNSGSLIYGIVALSQSTQPTKGIQEYCKYCAVDRCSLSTQPSIHVISTTALTSATYMTMITHHVDAQKLIYC